MSLHLNLWSNKSITMSNHDFCLFGYDFSFFTSLNKILQVYYFGDDSFSVPAVAVAALCSITKVFGLDLWLLREFYTVKSS